MKDIISLLITATCLAVAGAGLYLFSYKNDEEDTSKKGGKKKNNSKNNFDLDEYNNNNNSYDEHFSEDDNNDDEYYDNNMDTIKKTNSKVSKNKTKRIKNKFTVSKKNRY